ncbi:hypothetical protein PGT21_030049 [Puccinia graminis f. sp. tritici]|uniref:Uncharacterized protein n=1 Tax=Puccinia graminis f. sp. tritici TaxID=56615 RepID=A0A5B0MQ72_PUCGR|nr:hypothetical protein PGT21_030049 [Puccinia graminis f. sp. tritici]
MELKNPSFIFCIYTRQSSSLLSPSMSAVSGLKVQNTWLDAPAVDDMFCLQSSYPANKYRHSYTKENCAKITPIQLYRGSPENLNSTD